MQRFESTLSVAPFFLLRVPALAFTELAEWRYAASGADNPDAHLQTLRGWLITAAQRRDIREALYYASPSLEESIDFWLSFPDTERGAKVERGLVRYLTRMGSRPTPFGLFAAVAVGQVGDGTCLALGARSAACKRASIDAGWLSELCSSLLRSPALRRELVYDPNSSIFRSGGRLRYFEAVRDLSGRCYRLVGADESPELNQVLELASAGASFEQLAARLRETAADVDEGEADRFLHQLIDAQILVARLEPPITGGDGVLSLIGTLGATTEGKSIAGQLADAQRQLDRLDQSELGASTGAYRALATTLTDLADGSGDKPVIKGDLYQPSPGLAIDHKVAEEIARGCVLLSRIGQPGGASLDAFREAFYGRYESRAVPLLEVLDPDLGIGFPPTCAPPDWDRPTLPVLLRCLERAWTTGQQEIELTATELAALESAEPLPLPHSFAVGVVIAARSAEKVDEGDYQYLLQSVSGTSASTLLGRFCQRDPALTDAVRALIAQEEALEPEAVFAEIVHVPEGRLGNVIARPILRRYEIPFLGRSGVTQDRQIPVSDLLVSLDGEKIVLWSRRLDRKIIPTLSSAHNFNDDRCLPVYRFLGNLSSQRGRPIYFGWGPLGTAAFLPRVRAGRMVFSLAQWNVNLRAFGFGARTPPAESFQLLASLRERLRLPRFVTIGDEDHSLLIDLENPLCAEPLNAQARTSGAARLTEKFPAPDHLSVQGEGGAYMHEMVLPFVQSGGTSHHLGHGRKWSPAPVRPPLRHAPGASWLFAKLYTGAATLEMVLGALVEPLIAEARRDRAIDRWWYVRYFDPEPHLRLRLHGDPKWLWQRGLDMLQRYCAPALTDNTLNRVQLDTYEPEYERYGGPRGLELMELISTCDSDVCLTLVRHTPGDEGAVARRYASLRSVHYYLEDFGLGDEAKASYCRRLAGGFDGGADGRPRDHSLSKRFRHNRKAIEAATLASAEPEVESLLMDRRRSWMSHLQNLRRYGDEGGLSRSLEDILSSLLHMHLNRLLRIPDARRESQVYDHLARTYESLVARRARRQMVTP